VSGLHECGRTAPEALDLKDITMVGHTATHPDVVNRDLLAFCQQGKRRVA